MKSKLERIFHVDQSPQFKMQVQLTAAQEFLLIKRWAFSHRDELEPRIGSNKSRTRLFTTVRYGPGEKVVETSVGLLDAVDDALVDHYKRSPDDVAQVKTLKRDLDVAVRMVQEWLENDSVDTAKQSPDPGTRSPAE
jgi:hypothetical protein